MADPVGLLAQIHISKENYKKFLKTKAIDVITQQIHLSLINKQQDYYLYRYDAKNQILVCFVWFNYGGMQDLEGDVFRSLLSISSLSDPCKPSYIALSLDAFNWDHIQGYFVLENQKWTKPKLDLEQAKQIKSKALESLLESDKPFSEIVYTGGLLDSNIITRLKVIDKKHRLANLATIANNATALAPATLFEDFYYNGTVVFTTNFKGVIYPNIDLSTFCPTVYGACDANHVIVQGKILKTNPKKFKRIKTGNSTYYKTETYVYDKELNLLENSHAPSFKILNDELALDQNHFYFCGHTLERDPNLNYSFEQHPGSVWLLYTKDSIYFNGAALPVDVLEFSYVKPLENLKDTFAGFIGLKGTKHYGFVLHLGKIIELENTYKDLETFENTLQKTFGRLDRISKRNLDLLSYKSSDAYLEEFLEKCDTPWVFTQMQEFEDFLKEILTNLKQDNDSQILSSLNKVYPVIEPYLWMHAECYKQLALIFALKKEQNKALKALKNAIVYGAVDMVGFLDHEKFQWLYNENRFQELKDHALHYAYTGFKAPVQLEVLEKLISLPKTMDHYSKLLWKYHLYDNKDIVQAQKEHPELQDYYTRYISLNTDLFDRYFKRENLIDMDYKLYENYSCMPIEASLNHLTYTLSILTSLSKDIKQWMAYLVKEIDKVKAKIKNLDPTEYLYYKDLYNSHSSVIITEQFL